MEKLHSRALSREHTKRVPRVPCTRVTQLKCCLTILCQKWSDTRVTRVDETAQNSPPHQPVAALDLGVRGRKPKRRRVWVDDRAWIGLD